MEPRLRLKRSSPQAGLELTTARLVGQRLTHRATGAPEQIRLRFQSHGLSNKAKNFAKSKVKRG